MNIKLFQKYVAHNNSLISEVYYYFIECPE